MAHVPHLLVPAPWEGSRLELDQSLEHHLRRVLRRSDGSPVSYTDGAGTIGTGVFAHGAVHRGAERCEPAPPDVSIAAAAPHAADRARFLVEKCAELGVRRIVWVTTVHGHNRTPKPDKARAWAVAALQQSRGAHLTQVAGPVALEGLADDPWLVVADPDGLPSTELAWRRPVTVLIGPEGGLTPDEVRGRARLWLADGILRTETAAVVAAALAIQACRAG